MSSVSSGFHCSLVFLALFTASQTLAKPENSANSTSASSSGTDRQCENAYYNFYHNAEPNKKTETILQEIKKQLTNVEDHISILKGNTTLAKGTSNLSLTMYF